MASFSSDSVGGDSISVAERMKTYEDYLDSQISEEDLYYLEDQDLAREVCTYMFTSKPLLTSLFFRTNFYSLTCSSDGGTRFPWERKCSQA